MDKDIRWIQRFDSFQKALEKLESAVDITSERALSDLEEQGLIKAFEFTFEVAWKTLKDFYSHQGEDIQGSRDAVRMAFSRGLIERGNVWMEMIQSRNLTSHIYNEKVADEICEKIINEYFREFQLLKETLKDKKAD